MKNQPIEFLNWDSAHFGRRIARATCRQVDANACFEMLVACQEQDIECMYFLADASDQDTIAALQSNGYDLVDIRLTFSAKYSEMPSIGYPRSICFRLGDERDLDQLLPIAGNSFIQSRFYVDPGFDNGSASRMFQIWLEKSITSESGAAVIVAELNDAAVGFVTCHLHKPPGEGNIGLAGVAESARGLGCARAMFQQASGWISGQGLDSVNTVTQGRNIAAQRLFQRCGFVTRSVELWFHKWFDWHRG